MTTAAHTLEEIRRLLGAERVEHVTAAVAALKARLEALEQAVDPAELRSRLLALEASEAAQRAGITAALAAARDELEQGRREAAAEALQAREALETAADARAARLARDLAEREEQTQAELRAQADTWHAGQQDTRAQVAREATQMQAFAAQALEEVRRAGEQHRRHLAGHVDATAATLRATLDEAMRTWDERADAARQDEQALAGRRHEEHVEQAGRLAVLAARLETQVAALEQRVAERMQVLHERTDASSARTLAAGARLEQVAQHLVALDGLHRHFEERLAAGLREATDAARAQLAAGIDRRLGAVERHRQQDARRLAADTLIAVQRVEALAEDLRRELDVRTASSRPHPGPRA